MCTFHFGDTWWWRPRQAAALLDQKVLCGVNCRYNKQYRRRYILFVLILLNILYCTLRREAWENKRVHPQVADRGAPLSYGGRRLMKYLLWAFAYSDCFLEIGGWILKAKTPVGAQPIIKSRQISHKIKISFSQSILPNVSRKRSSH